MEPPLTDRARAFLGVEESATGRRWVGSNTEQDRLSLSMAQKTGLAEALCRILVRQNVAWKDAEAYLNPSMKDWMPDPSSLKDMDKAVMRFVKAVDNKERIAIFADYDVDGASSAAQIIWWLRSIGHTARLYVPDRIEEGFGPNSTAMAALAKEHSLIVCVDCGSSSRKAIAAADGADVIVLDHHSGEPIPPPAYALVNPNRQDEVSELVYLCAAGLVFMFLIAVNRALRPRGIDLPDLLKMLDLVSLATVADVSPLIDLNRVLVRHGLKVMQRRHRPGLAALADVAKLQSPPNTYHLGFVFGPRINAAGRIGKSDLGARLLATDNPVEAQEIARQLDELNNQRKKLVDEITAAAIAAAENRGFDGPLVWAADRGWHPGVVGIVASKLVEKSGRPAVVLGIVDQSAKGSARSIAGVDIGYAIMRCRDEGLLIAGGGHKMAGGIHIETKKIPAAMQRLAELCGQQAESGIDLHGLRIDGVIQPSAATVPFVIELERAGPFGSQSPPPRFAFSNVTVSYSRRLSGPHMKLDFKDETGNSISGIAFGAFENGLGQFFENQLGRPMHVAGQLVLNSFRNSTTVQLNVHDAAPA